MKKYYNKSAAIRAAHNAGKPMMVVQPSGIPRCYVPACIYSVLATDKAIAFVDGNYVHEFDDGR